jgi:hypothetical protein
MLTWSTALADEFALSPLLAKGLSADARSALLHAVPSPTPPAMPGVFGQPSLLPGLEHCRPPFLADLLNGGSSSRALCAAMDARVGTGGVLVRKVNGALDEAGRLVCKVCSRAVGDDALWPAHQAGAPHAAALAALAK